MASHPRSGETPNLLDLVEAGARAIASGDASPCSDEAQNLGLTGLSLSAGEASDDQT